ncbi:glycosyltransferase family 2 protein [Desulfuromonas sp. KJ2020]|uniref:glycosyltransferase family 2 protein n=1 Tax=Desulfuromonas sp. KJ2020 TaxID=2919173 RepID=UPI0020A7684F|nr:glycosyltransferase family 2 protein [Desulfuromonas sp. KJ2020]MCP3178134.1 glycosyltransferase family 2 protein [Desulfuromonas sp. KJ2020]
MSVLLVLYYIFIISLLIYVGLATIYLLFMAASYFVLPQKKLSDNKYLNRFMILVPAHNEELLIGTLCQSLLQVNYPYGKYKIFVIADNCNDKTIKNASEYDVEILERHDLEHSGKGHALAWALEEVPVEEFDAVLMVDADNYVDTEILQDLNRHINSGEKAIQCYNAVGNRDDSWFTQLLYVSRTIGNLLYHESKYRLGLSSYLMGNGLCFNAKLLQERGWTAFSTGEDWEYYAQLIESDVKISFASEAKVYHQESRSLDQATSQRLRWSSGRFHIAKTLGLKLMSKGIVNKNIIVLDASMPLILPNYSLLVNLTLVSALLTLMVPEGEFKTFAAITITLIIVNQLVLFLMGLILAGSPRKTMFALIYVPVFLVWKLIIDILTFTGIYKGNKWVRTNRH